VPLQSEDHFGKSIPVETYGLAKYMIAREIESRNDKKSLNLRLFGVFGPYEDYRRRFLSNNICRVISGHSVMVNRDMKFDYLDVSDLGRFLSGLIQAGCNLSGSYNFCTGKPMRLTDIGAMIAEKMLGTRSVEVVDAGENAEYSGSPARIFSEYGSFTFTPIEDSLSNLIEYYKKELVADKLEEFKRFLIGK
jgi:GDP-L-fucose synthase